MKKMKACILEMALAIYFKSGMYSPLICGHLHSDVRTRNHQRHKIVSTLFLMLIYSRCALGCKTLPFVLISDFVLLVMQTWSLLRGTY